MALRILPPNFSSGLLFLAALAGLAGLFPTETLACDYCGLFMGVRPYQRQHRIELNYRYRSYGGYVNVPDYAPAPKRQRHPFLRTSHDPALHSENPQYSPDDRNIFQTWELRGTFFLGERWNVGFVLPFQAHRHTFDEETTRFSGPGDVMALAGYFFAVRDSADLAWQWQVLGGAKLPSGNWSRDAQTFARDAHFQSGTGSWDGLLGLAGSFRWKNWLSTTNFIYRMNAENPVGYRFLNAVNLTQTFAYNVKLADQGPKQLHLFPNAGIYYENGNGETLNGQWMRGTGGQILFGTAGLDAQIRRLGLTLSAQLPVFQDLLGTQLGCGGRLIAGVNYSFGG